MRNTKHFWKTATLATLLPFSAGLLLTGCGGESNQGNNGMPPMPVTAMVVSASDVEVIGEYPARVRGVRQIEVRARVSGILEQRMFAEGERVEEGTALFQIEEAPYRIALRMARAEQSNAEAAYRQAEREWRRISGLFEQNAISERERDAALSARELAEARLESAQARVADAELQLDYTRVPAPISGYTGMETLSEGSLIERGTLLTTIVQHDPVQVRFSIPEREATVRRGTRSQAVEVLLPDGERITGLVDFTDSSIDPTMGSVRARALIENAEGLLVPGQFVRVRLLLAKLENVFRIPPGAISEGPEGRQVFVLKSDNTVEARPVRLGPIVDGQQVVLEGLKDEDKLIINGHVMLQPGMPVQARIQDKEAR